MNSPNSKTDTPSHRRRIVVTITTNDEPSWRELINIGRDVGPGTVLDSLQTTQIGCVYVINATGQNTIRSDLARHRERRPNPSHANRERSRTRMRFGTANVSLSIYRKVFAYRI